MELLRLTPLVFAPVLFVCCAPTQLGDDDDDDDDMSCIDKDLGSAMGVDPAPYEGTTEGAGNDHTDHCSIAAEGPDLAFRWSPESDGDYGFLVNTTGEWDSVLTVFDACAGSEVGCNDDSPWAEEEPALWSEWWGDLEGGAEYVLVVDGVLPDDAGAFSLEIFGGS